MGHEIASKENHPGGFDHNKLAEILSNGFDLPEHCQFAVGFSGGADSTALLLGLHRMLGADCSRRLLALHFNHRIHPDADRWQDHCQSLCDHLGIPMLAERWQRDPAAVPTEAMSRDARYRWFETILSEGNVLCLAQHRDDQVETVLMNLMEKRDLHRVSGMRPRRALTFGDRRLVIRPLLGCTRSELREFVTRAGVKWVEDPANQDVAQRRAWLRHHVLPQLRTSVMDLDARVISSAQLLQRAVSMLDGFHRRELGTMIAGEQRRIFCLSPPLRISMLVSQERSHMLSLLRTWIHDAALDSPGNKALGNLVASLEGANATHHLAWRHGAVRAYRGLLYLLGPLPQTGEESPWFVGRTQLTDGLQVVCEAIQKDGVAGEGIADSWRWCWRRGGEKVRLPGRSHSSSLKKTCQQFGIPPWERDSLPFLCSGSEVLWVRGIGWCGSMADFARSPGGIDFEPRFYWQKRFIGLP